MKFKSPGPVMSAFLRSNNRWRLAVGPFGSGKSSACTIEVPRRAAEQAHAPDGFRHTRFAIVRNTGPQLRDTTIKTWMNWFPNGSIGVWHSTSKTYFIKIGDLRCEVMFRALDDEQDIKNLLSLELTGAWLNECREIPWKIFEALDGRIERFPNDETHGKQTWCGIWADTNPPTMDTFWWAAAEGLDTRVEEEEHFGREMPDGETNGWDSFIQPSGLSPYAENLDNLPPNYYQNLAKNKSKAFIDMYVHGKYGKSTAGSPVHGEFDPTIHARGGLEANPHKAIVISADFGLTPAVTLKQQGPFGNILTLASISTKGMGLERMIEERLKPMLNDKYHDARLFVTGDPSGGTPDQYVENTALKIFKKHGFKKIRLAHTNDPVARIGATDHWLTRNFGGEPAFQVDKYAARGYARALAGGYHYPISRKGEESDAPAKNFHSHVAEAGQYADLLYLKGFHDDSAARLHQRARFTQGGVKPGSYTHR